MSDFQNSQIVQFTYSVLVSLYRGSRERVQQMIWFHLQTEVWCVVWWTFTKNTVPLTAILDMKYLVLQMNMLHAILQQPGSESHVLSGIPLPICTGKHVIFSLQFLVQLRYQPVLSSTKHSVSICSYSICKSNFWWNHLILWSRKCAGMTEQEKEQAETQ